MAKKRPAKKTSEELQKAFDAVFSSKTVVGDDKLLSTGSTLLNLAITGKAGGGFPKGTFVLLIGSSSSGKTFLSLTCLAEAAIDADFNDYRFIFDDVEGGALMNIEKFFGKAVATRLEPPRTDDEGAPVYSRMLEDMYFNLDDAIQEAKKPNGKPFIYIIDSLDSLSSYAEQKKFNQNKRASRTGGEQKGSFGDGKAKINSQYLRSVVYGLRETNSILIAINQERDNPDAGLFQSKKTHSGGKSLKHYTPCQIWFSKAKSIKKKVLGKDRIIGNMSKIEVKKNRLTGKDRTIEIPIYYSHGLDDIGSCIDYLIDEDVWHKRGASINTNGDFGLEKGMTMDKLVAFIEETDERVQELRQLVEDHWLTVESLCTVKRKPRYE